MIKKTSVIIKEGELKKVCSKGIPVYVDYWHPNPEENQTKGFAVVEYAPESGVYLEPYSERGIDFTMDFDFTGNDDEECTSEGIDGDVLIIYKCKQKRGS